MAACAACRVAAVRRSMQVCCMERHFAAFRRAGERSGRRTVEPCPCALGPDGAVEPPARRGEAGAMAGAEWDSHSGSAMVTRPRARHHDRDKGPETRSSVGPTVGLRWADGGTAPRTGDGRCGIRGFGPTRIGRHRSSHWTRHARACDARRGGRSQQPCDGMHHVTISITITAPSMVRCTPLKARKLYVVASTSDAPRGFTRQRSQVHPLDGPPR